MTDHEATLSVPRVGRRRAAITNIAFQYVALALVVTQGVLLVPLYLRTISLAVYGAWLATGNVLAWIELVDPGFSTVLQQRAATSFGKQDAEGLATTIGTGLGVSFALAALPLLAWPFAHFITGSFGLNVADAAVLETAFRIALLSTSLAIASYGVAAVNLAVQSSMAAGTAYTVSGVASIAVTILFLRNGLGLLALPLAGVIRSGLLLLGNGIGLWRWLATTGMRRPGFDRTEARSLARQSLYTFTGRLGSILATRVDLFITATLVSPGAAASLALTGKAFELVRLGTERIATGLAPGLAHLAGERGLGSVGAIAESAIRVSMTGAAVGILGVVALNAPFVRLWVGQSAFGGAGLTAALALAAGAGVLSTAIYLVANSLGLFRATATSTIAEATVKLGLLFVLVRWLGVLAVPVASSAAVLLVSINYLPRAIAAAGGARIRARRWLVPVMGAIAVGSAAASLSVVKQIATWPRFGFGATTVFVAGMLVALSANWTWVREVLFRRRLDG